MSLIPNRIEDIKRARERLYNIAGGERSGMGFTVMEAFMDDVNVLSAANKVNGSNLEKKNHEGANRRVSNAG